MRSRTLLRAREGKNVCYNPYKQIPQSLTLTPPPPPSRHGLVLTGHRAGNTSMNGDVCIWDINGRLCMNKLKDVHVSEVNTMALSPCGLKLFTAGGADDPTMKEWDLRMMKKVKNVGFHKDRIQALGLLTTPGVSYLTHASKDGTNGLTAVTKSGVIRSKQVAEMDDFQGWSTHVSLVPMKLGDVKFAGGQKRKSTPDIFTVGTDRQLRQYDLSDFIKLSDPKTASELPEGGVEKDFSKMKLNAEDNYHKQQSDFWDSFPSSEEVHGAAMKAKAKKEEEKDDGVARDKYGNEVGSIEYWVAKGNEPKVRFGVLVCAFYVLSTNTVTVVVPLRVTAPKDWGYRRAFRRQR